MKVVKHNSNNLEIVKSVSLQNNPTIMFGKWISFLCASYQALHVLLYKRKMIFISCVTAWGKVWMVYSQKCFVAKL